jgi:hypothetical protein
MRTTLLLLCLTATGCAAGFRGIYPGMNAGQVAEAMGGVGPASVVPYDQGYAGWYYNEDQCVLMQNNVVVSKAVSQSQGGIAVAGLGGFSMKQRAQCLPPGVQADTTPTVNVGIPGANIKVR